jgi:DNA-binding transcriptional regulator YiaG
LALHAIHAEIAGEDHVTEKYPPDFGDELRRLRTAAGLSLTQLAEKAHYSKGHLSKIETGMRLPTAGLARHCDAVLAAGGVLVALAAARRAAPRPAETVYLEPLVAGRPPASLTGLRAAAEPPLPVRFAFRPLVDRLHRLTGARAVLHSVLGFIMRAGDYARVLAEESAGTPRPTRVRRPFR